MFAGRTSRGSTAELSLHDALELVKNQAALDELRAEWAAQHDALDAKIALAGEADAIVRLRAEAEADRVAAAERLRSVADQAERAAEDALAMVEAAKKDAATLREQGEADRTAATQEADRIRAENQGQRDQIAAGFAGNEDRARELDAWEERLKAETAGLAAQMTELDRRREAAMKLAAAL